MAVARRCFPYFPFERTICKISLILFLFRWQQYFTEKKPFLSCISSLFYSIQVYQGMALVASSSLIGSMANGIHEDYRSRLSPCSLIQPHKAELQGNSNLNYYKPK